MIQLVWPTMVIFWLGVLTKNDRRRIADKVMLMEVKFRAGQFCTCDFRAKTSFSGRMAVIVIVFTWCLGKKCSSLYCQESLSDENGIRDIGIFGSNLPCKV